MRCLLQRVVLVLSVTALLVGGHSAAGNPIGDFFKRLGDSIAHPHSSPPPRRNPRQSTTEKKRNDNQKTTPPDARPVVPSVPRAPTPTPTPLTVRAAAGVPPTKGPRLDMPYGIPVPNKPGFVTSPYAPKSGYVDVHGFPSGIEVKDPYTGKIFLTP